VIDRVDIAVAGSGVGGLMAAALLARRGFSVTVVERSDTFGGAAAAHSRAELPLGRPAPGATGSAGGEPVASYLAEAGILQSLRTLPPEAVYEVRGGPVGTPFRLPVGFDAARAAIADRFPEAARGAGRVLDDMARIARATETAAKPRSRLGSLARAPGMARSLWPLVSGWDRTLADVLERSLAGQEGAKFALAANLPRFDDRAHELWWPAFATVQAGRLAGTIVQIAGGPRVLVDCLVETIRANGGTVIGGRAVREILLTEDGAVRGLSHAASDGGPSDEIAAPVVLANAAPTVVAGLLPNDARPGFVDGFRGRALSISLFAAHFGLSRSPSELGVTTASSILVPDWIERLSSTADCAALLADRPGSSVPLLEVFNASSVGAGNGASTPHVVTVTGFDRVANWQDLSPSESEDRSAAWIQAIEAELNWQYPGFAEAITSRMFATAATHARALNAPGGALYGFAPMPPGTPVWKGYPRSADTPVPGLLLASAYAGAGGVAGALAAGGMAADRITRTGGKPAR